MTSLLYWLRNYGKILFVVVAIVLAAIFIWYSGDLTRDLSVQEKERMSLWADATHALVSSDMNSIDFPLEVVEGNRNIPVILTDSMGNLLFYRNIDDSSQENLDKSVDKLRKSGNSIEIKVSEQETQYIYYEDSDLLRRLTIYPWIELAIIAAFLIITYIGFNASKKMEQNRVWVGLSKETAHQLGTPISSLMGWLEYLKESGADSRIVEEMTKDVVRLSDVSSRFSKIGSRPSMTVGDVSEAVFHAVDYMRGRIPSKMSLDLDVEQGKYDVRMSEPLIQWVMENLIKNAVDASDGMGKIIVRLRHDANRIVITVTDFGKGIARRNRKKVFQPGFTTKKRGWGLGLSLTKRIVADYHGGTIEVAESDIGKGTVMRLTLPMIET